MTDASLSTVAAWLAAQRSAGVTQIPLKEVESFLTLVASDSIEAGSPEAEAWRRELWKFRTSLDHQAQLEQYRSVLEAGQTALKALMAMNAGAAVALLAFTGNLLTKGFPPGASSPIPSLKEAIAGFLFGVALVGAASAARYFTQLAGSLRHSWLFKTQGFLIGTAVSFGLLSLGAFVWSGFIALGAF